MATGSTQEIAQAEAMRWFDVLKEEPDDPTVVAGFMNWLKSSESNVAAWHRLEMLNALAAEVADDELLPEEASQSQVKAPRSKTSPKRPRISSGMAALMALAAVFIGLVAFAVLPDLLIDMTADHVTAAGETRVLELADGSRLMLGANSAITVDIEPKRRGVGLLRGVAYFDVASDPLRPFEVNASGVTTRVTGTGFEVRRLDDGARVAVAAGTVKVLPAGEKNAKPASASIALEAGQRIRYSAAKNSIADAAPPTPSAVDPDKVANWRRGALIVENWTAHELFDALKAQYPGFVVIGDWGLARRRVSGIFQLDNPVQALRLAAASQGLRVRQIAPGFLVVSRF